MNILRKVLFMIILSLGIFTVNNRVVNADEDTRVITKNIDFKTGVAESFRFMPNKTGVYNLSMGDTGFEGNWYWYDSDKKLIDDAYISSSGGDWAENFYMVAGKTYYFEFVSQVDISIPVTIQYYGILPPPGFMVLDSENGRFLEEEEISKLRSQGITWDKENLKLTLENVDTNLSFRFFADNHIFCNVDSKDLTDPATITIEIKGENKIDLSGTGTWNCVFSTSEYYSVKVIGDGKLDMLLAPYGDGIDSFNIEIDGPTLNFLSKDKDYRPNECFYARNDIVMKSGNIYAEFLPFVVDDGGYENKHECLIYQSIFWANSIVIEDGNIIVKYKNIDVDGDMPISSLGMIYAYDSIEILSGNIYVIGDEKVIYYFKNDDKDKFVEGICHGYDEKTKINIDKTKVNILMGQIIDLNDIDMYLEKTEYIYDGKAKKPIVFTLGLREGIDYEVVYSNNVEVGKATVTVKAKEGSTLFKGSKTLTFNIIKNKKPKYSPVKGTVITDGKYIYKVLKRGTTKLSGTVSIIGLKKKNIKTVKIKSAVKIDGITYKIISIGKGAFKNNKKIKKVYIGKNIKKIGKYAFKGDKKLKRIIIKTVKLKKSKVGKKAFYKTSKKLVVKVPKGKRKRYKKIIRARGNKKAKVK